MQLVFRRGFFFYCSASFELLCVYSYIFHCFQPFLKNLNSSAFLTFSKDLPSQRLSRRGQSVITPIANFLDVTHFLRWSYQHLSSVTQEGFFILLEPGTRFLVLMALHKKIVHILAGWRKLTGISDVKGVMVKYLTKQGRLQTRFPIMPYRKESRCHQGRWWSSGRISTYHGTYTGSIPGQCM